MIRPCGFSFRFATGLLLVSVLLGCQYGASPQSGGASANGQRHNMLKVESKSPDIMKRYNSFYIADIGVYELEGDRLRRIENAEVTDLAEEFRAKLIRGLGNQHSPIPQRASNLAMIKVALTDVSTTYAAFQLLPGLVVPNALRGGASIDATVVDSVSNEVLVRVRDSRQGERQGFFSGLGKYDGAERAFDEWANILSEAITH